MNNLPLVLKDDNGIRPAGEPDKCFYCNQKVGESHKEDCVILNKKVTVQYSFIIEIEVPYSWDEEMIRFHRNDSSWCADNSLHEIKEAAGDGCLCGKFEAKVLEVPNAEPYRKNDKGDIVP